MASMRLPAAELAAHAKLIEATKACSKIFFRVDTDALRDFQGSTTMQMQGHSCSWKRQRKTKMGLKTAT